MAARTARAEPMRVFVPAIVIFALDAFATTTFTELSVDHHGLESVVALFVLTLSTLGLTFYSGLLERLVGAVERNEPAPPLRHVLQSMPYRRLLIADAMLWVLNAVASAVFILPGLVVTTLFVLVGPLLNMENVSILAAFRKSAALVWPRFLLVLGLLAVPLSVEHDVVAAVADLVPRENLALVFGTNAIMGLVFGVALGLVEVSMAERLLHGAQGPGMPCDAQLRSGGTSAPADPVSTEGGHHGRDDSRDGHAGAGTDPGGG
jgi:hypothetical protein